MLALRISLLHNNHIVRVPSDPVDKATYARPFRPVSIVVGL